MLVTKSYFSHHENTARVSGRGFMAGKPVSDIVPGDVIFSFTGDKVEVIERIKEDREKVVLRVISGRYGESVIRLKKNTIRAVAWRSADDAARYGHIIGDD